MVAVKKRALWPGILGAVVVILFLLPTIFALLGGIPTRQDWTYDQLPGGYEVWILNSHQIDLLKDRETVIGPYLSYIAWDGDFLFLQQVTLPEDWEVWDGVDDLPPRYYLVHTEREKVLGPYEDFSELKAACEAEGISPPETWTRTTELPEQE